MIRAHWVPVPPTVHGDPELARQTIEALKAALVDSLPALGFELAPNAEIVITAYDASRCECPDPVPPGWFIYLAECDVIDTLPSVTS